jgi:hypothetical protein
MRWNEKPITVKEEQEQLLNNLNSIANQIIKNSEEIIIEYSEDLKDENKAVGGVIG